MTESITGIVIQKNILRDNYNEYEYLLRVRKYQNPSKTSNFRIIEEFIRFQSEEEFFIKLGELLDMWSIYKNMKGKK